MQDILEKPLNFMHCVASRFGYANYRLSELSLVPISSDNRRSYCIYFLATGFVAKLCMYISREVFKIVGPHS